MAKNKKGSKELLYLLIAVFLGVAIFVIVQVVISNNKYNGFHNKVDTIKYSKYQDLVSSDDSFILIYGSNTCSFCNSFKETYAEVLDASDVNEDEVVTYYIDSSTYTEDQIESITSYYNISGTPYTLMFIDGELVNQLDGEKQYTETKEFINDFILKNQED